MVTAKIFKTFLLAPDKRKKGLQSGSYEPDCRPVELFRCDLTEFPGYPANLAPDLHSLPAVEGAGHILQNGTRRDSNDTAVAGAVARADVDLAARGFDRHQAPDRQQIDRAGRCPNRI